jgi:hypothetical protein
MLGEKIGAEKGKVTGRRVLPGDEDTRYLKLEISMETEATILGVAGMGLATYTVVERGPGQLYGDGRGMFMSADGQTAIWNGHGVGRMDENGGMHFAASVVFQTTSEKLSKLNSILTLVEHHADMQGNASSDLFAWTA